MLDLCNDVCLSLFDVLLGWLLYLPRWSAVVAVALLTAVLMALIRKWTTNQDRLRRAAADLRRLKEIGRDATRANDRAALTRCQSTKSQISVIKLKAEGGPLLVVLLPIALLAIWAYQRLGYYSPTADQTIQVKVYLPKSAQEDVLHLVPQSGLSSVNGWVQPVRLERNEPTRWDRFWARVTLQATKTPDSDAVAIWQIKSAARAEPYRLVVRWKDNVVEHDLLVGQTRYGPAEVPSTSLEIEPGVPVISVVRMREVRLLGIPGWEPWLPPWLVGYLLVTIALVPLLKSSLRIY